MSVPNLRFVVEQVRASQAWDFSTKEGLCRYSNAVVLALHQQDSGFGHLRKFVGQNHCVEPGGGRCAVDVALYRPTGQIVDFIFNAGPGSDNVVTWGVGPEGEYGPDRWFAPIPELGGNLPIPGTPPQLPVNLGPLETRLSLLETRAALIWEAYAELAKQIGILNQQNSQLTDEIARLKVGKYHVHRIVGSWHTGGPT